MAGGPVQFTGFTDPLEMLEIVHAAADRLRELAGPAFVVTIAPADAPAPDGPAEELLAAMRSLRDELVRQNESIGVVTGREALRTFADVVSGNLGARVHRQLQTRPEPPSAGGESAAPVAVRNGGDAPAGYQDGPVAPPSQTPPADEPCPAALAGGESAVNDPARNDGDAPALRGVEESVAPSSSTPSAAPHRGGHPPAPTNRASAKRAEVLVADYLREHGGRGRQAGIAADLGLEAGRVRDALSRMSLRGEARRTGTSERAPGVTIGRASPVWELADDHGAAGSSGETAAPRAQGEAEAADRPAPDTCSTGRASAGSERVTPGEGEGRVGASRSDGSGAGSRASSPGPSDTPDSPHELNVSPRTRRSIERAQAEEAAAASIGDPPASDVMDLLRERAMSVHELAGVLGRSHVLIAEELHLLKPWVDRIPDGKWRAVARLRRAAA